MKKAIYKWIEIEYDRDSVSGKTKVFTVKAIEDRFLLGEIRWFPRWRKYAFFPNKETVFEEDCLENIADFLKFLKEERKK